MCVGKGGTWAGAKQQQRRKGGRCGACARAGIKDNEESFGESIGKMESRGEIGRASVLERKVEREREGNVSV
jgi:hypothetical protein